MWVIVEIYNHAVICYPEGDVMIWCDKDAAMAYCEAISSRNEGVFLVQDPSKNDGSLIEKKTHGYRLTRDKRDPLKISGCFQLPKPI